MRFKSKGLKNNVVGANVVIIALLFLTLSAYAGSVPNVFTSGTVAKSSEVNANFSYLGERCWDKSGSNLYFNGGNVGIGTSSPSRTLHIKDDGSQGNYISDPDVVIESTTPTGGSYFYLANDKGLATAIGLGGSSFGQYGGPNSLNILVKEGTSEIWTPAIIVKNPSGYVGMGTVSPSYPLHMASGAYVTTGGVWTNASSREYKKDIQSLTYEDAMLAFNKLEPVSFKYKTNDEQHIGFIAEDVPDLVASKDRKGLSTMDVVALLTKVVQEQQKTIAELQEQQKIAQEQQKTIVELKEEVRALKERTN
ncbi:MAG: tail fiber domain-containing protein [Candidatus Magnetobacterium sp. LHC-1]